MLQCGKENLEIAFTLLYERKNITNSP